MTRSAPATQTLTSIDISGVSPELAQKLRQSLPVHEGDQISRMNMPQILAAAHQIDEHFSGGLSVNRNNEATLHLTLATPPAAGVSGGVAGGPQSAPMSPPQRIRVGGNVQQANLIQKMTPAYPADAKEARIQGVVQLSVVIGKDGTVQNVDLISGHPLLATTAIDAVRQWVYKPTLLNGNPVEVITQVDVNFTLSQ